MVLTVTENGVRRDATATEIADRGTLDTAGAVDALIGARDVKVREFLDEGVSRVAAEVPDWDSLTAIKTAAGAWPALAAGATPEMLAAKNIYLYVRATAIPAVEAMTVIADIEAVDPTDPEPFLGQPWP